MFDFRALLRFRGVHWAIACGFSFILMAVSSEAFSYPPSNIEQWPDEAVRAVIYLASAVGCYQRSAWLTGAWILLLNIPASGRWDKILKIVSCLARYASVFSLVVGSLAFFKSFSSLQALNFEGIIAVLQVTFRVAIIPILIGLLPLCFLAAFERLNHLPFLRRLFHTGRGAKGGWMNSIDLKHYTQPLPRRLK